MMAHENDWRSLYPFASHFLPLGAGQYHYVDEGCGEPLLMVHGNPTWSFYWRNLVLGLRDRYRTLAPDHLGCGLSDKPQNYEYTLRQHIANLVQLVDALDLSNVTLLARLGGSHRSGSRSRKTGPFFAICAVQHGGLSAPLHSAANSRVPYSDRWRSGSARTESLFPCGPEHGDEQAGTHDGGGPCRTRGTLRQLGTPGGHSSLRPGHPPFPSAPYMAGPSRDRAATTDAGRPPLPAHLGHRDWCFRPLCLDRLQRIFPQAEVHRIADAGHYVIEDAHEKIIPWVRDFCRDPRWVNRPSAVGLESFLDCWVVRVESSLRRS